MGAATLHQRMETRARIYVAGHQGMVGSALWRCLQREGYQDLIGKSRSELNLTDSLAVSRFFDRERPTYVFLAAARVGGIHANETYPADFIYENLEIQNNVIRASHDHGVRKLLFLGSSCIYPKLAAQPITEDALLTGTLEPTNQWYAIAKIAGVKLCQAFRRQYGDDFIAVMPSNLYGPGDNFHPENSHVLPALIRRFHEARDNDLPEVVVWGTGSPLREFLHADDLATACLFLMKHYSDEQIVNVGSSIEVSIRELAEMIQETVGYNGRVVWDTSKPDGTQRKLLDSSRVLQMGWRPQIDLRTGIRLTYEAFKAALAGRAPDQPAGPPEV